MLDSIKDIKNCLDEINSAKNKVELLEAGLVYTLRDISYEFIKENFKTYKEAKDFFMMIKDYWEL